MLERTATADLFKNTLSRIPTVFGRLAYLASLRGPDSGVYGHHGLTLMFGREESKRALARSHHTFHFSERAVQHQSLRALFLRQVAIPRTQRQPVSLTYNRANHKL